MKLKTNFVAPVSQVNMHGGHFDCVQTFYGECYLCGLCDMSIGLDKGQLG